MSVPFFLRSCACLLALLPLASAQAADSPPFALEDLRRIVHLSDVSIAPDGRHVVVVVSTPDWKTDKPLEEMDLVDVSTGERRPLTWKRTGVSSPRWSEDGTRVAFLAEDAADPEDPPSDSAGHRREDATSGTEPRVPQVWVMSMSGGDPIRVTSARRGVDGFAWSPDGSQIAYVTADEAPNAKAIKEHDDAFRVTDNHFLARAALTPWHLWLTPATGGTPRRLTSGAFSLHTDQQDGPPALSWRSDGRSVVFTRFPGPYFGPAFRATLAAVDVASGTVSEVVGESGVSAPAYAHGRDVLAFQRPRGGDQNNGTAVYVREGGSLRDVTRDLARHVHAFAWAPDAGALLLQGSEGVHGVLWEQPLQGTARRLDLGRIEAEADFSVSRNGVVAFVGSTSSHPEELYVLDSTHATPRRLGLFNGFADKLRMAVSTGFEWDGPDGFTEDGVLTLPSETGSPVRHPLVLLIHGGPTASSTLRFSPLPQLLAAAGFVVLQPNYRGSDNRGDAYQHAIFRDTGEGPGKDVMAGVAAARQLAVVDGDRVAVSGWSYGGYMTTWLTGHYPGWKAAVAGAALTDWVMDYTVAFYQQGDLYVFGGSPWSAEYEEIWRAQSPIQSARKVTAPTLILGDVGDANVPLLNSYEWFHALRDAGVEVEFYAYPVDSHFPRDIVRTTDVYRRWVDWLSRHLDGARTPPG